MKFLTDLSLWKKITILTALGLALGVGVFSSLSIRSVNQATEAMLQDRLTTAHIVSDYVDEVLSHATNELQNSVQIIETNITENRGVTSNIQPFIEKLESDYSRLSISTHGIYLVDVNGQVVWSKSESAKVDKIDIAAYPDIIQAMAEGETVVSRIVSAPVSGIPVILLISRINTEQETGRYVLCVAINLAQSNIGLFIRPIRLGQTGYVEIIDQSGVVITRTEPGPKLAPFEKSDHSGRFAALINAGKPTRGICHTCHEARQKVESRDVLAFVPLSKTRWGVIVRQSEEEALAATNELRQNLFLFGIGLAILFLVFVIAMARNVTSRISLLTVASKRIAQGDLSSPITTSGRDEVGMLGQTFDEMRCKLKTSYDNLEQKTKELSSLLSVSEILTSAFELPTLLEAVVTKAVQVIPGADGGVLLLENDTGNSLTVQCAVGLDNQSLPQIPLSDGQPTEDGLRKAVSIFLQSEALRPRVQSLVCAELVHQKRHIGSLIVLSSKCKEGFSVSDHRLLQAVADDIVIAIERDKLRKEADEARALYETDRLRSQFISSVSHELRTPLTLIKGYATSLLRQNVIWDERTQQEFLQAIDTKTDELRELIEKLLQSAKLEAGAFKLQKEPLLIPQLARQVIEESAQRTKKHQFHLKFASSFPVLEADGRCVEQVLRNLVENAIKYSPDGGQITISGDVSDSQAIVSVKDEGIGIPPGCQDKIFERFYRVENRLTRTTPGCGLGLSICKGHVEAHEGKVWLESTPGKGSVFHFSLPLSRKEGNLDEGRIDGRKNLNSCG